VTAKIPSLLFVSFSLAIPVLPQRPESARFDGKSWWKQVKVLANDNMEARDTRSAKVIFPR